jgi:flagellar protein FlaG
MAIQISLTLPANGGQSLSTGPRPAATQPSPAVAGNAQQVQESVPQPQSQSQTPVDTARLNEAVDTINRRLQDSSQQLRFAVDHDSGRMVVRVVDTATDQTIRQIPSEVAIAISQSLEKLQGLLVRQQA